MEGNRKYHLVNRRVVRSPMKGGGFRVKDIKVLNKALSGKWKWRFREREMHIGGEVVAEKYDIVEGEQRTRNITTLFVCGL